MNDKKDESNIYIEKAPTDRSEQTDHKKAIRNNIYKKS